MIERSEVDGRPATLIWIADDFEPAEPADATVCKVVFDDGEVAFLAVNQDDDAADEWNEGDHPRGQPENAGEFSSGGGGSKKSEGSPTGGEKSDYVKQFLDAVPDEMLNRALKARAAKGVKPDLKSRDDVFRNMTQELDEIRQRPSTAASMNDPGRVELQESIADDLDEHGGFAEPGHDIPRKSERRVDLVLGPPASGKSSHAVEPLLQEHGAILLDADEAKKMLPEFDSGLGSSAVHVESAKITENILARHALARGDNIVQPLVGKNLKKIDQLITSYVGAGYSVNLHFTDLPIEKAMQRAMSRYVETGRFMDPGYVESIDHLPEKTFNALKTRKDINSYEAISTDVPVGEEPRVIEHG